jgi:hypothetical protein
MKRKAVVSVIVGVGLLCVIASFPVRAFAQFDESKSLPVDAALFAEFYKILVKSTTNVVVTGEMTIPREGTKMIVKFTAYRKDLEYLRIDSEADNEPVAITLTPSEAWLYLKKQDILFTYSDRTTLANANTRLYMESVKKNGKITKSAGGGKTIYLLTDFTSDIKMAYTVDNKTGLILSAKKRYGRAGTESEKIFKEYKFTKIDDSKFERPKNVKTVLNADHMKDAPKIEL